MLHFEYHPTRICVHSSPKLFLGAYITKCDINKPEQKPQNKCSYSELVILACSVLYWNRIYSCTDNSRTQKAVDGCYCVSEATEPARLYFASVLLPPFFVCSFLDLFSGPATA